MHVKYVKNRLLTATGNAIASLRYALELAERNELLDEAAEIEEQIESLIDLNNQLEQI
jgi:hypothetical protein